MKNLYLPGTNKNVGYLDKDTLYIYSRYKKYLPFLFTGVSSTWDFIADRKFILTSKENNKEEHVQLVRSAGYWYNIDTAMWQIMNCQFKTPDNLDVIEMAYLYKHWNTSNG